MTFAAFWPLYLADHRHPLNRRLHFLGTACYLVLLGLLVGTGRFAWLGAVPVVAYAFAWSGHFLVEHNRPATFQHPWLSLLGDHKMVWLALTGRLAGEYERLGISSL